MHTHNLFFLIITSHSILEPRGIRQNFAWNESIVCLTFSSLMHNTSHVCLNPWIDVAQLNQFCDSNVFQWKNLYRKGLPHLKLLTKFNN